MKSDRAHSKYTYAICIYVILFLSAILPAFLAVKNIKISPDSMIYALISQEIVSGNGIKLPILIDMESNLSLINGMTPHFDEPPLLPILYAILGGVTPQSFLPAQIINVISHIVVVIISFLLMSKLYDNKGIALLTGISVSVSYPLLWNTHYIITEPLFIALTAAMLYFLIFSRYIDNDKSPQYFIIASICTSASILTRYAGLALIPVFFWEIIILIKINKIKLKSISTIISALLPVMTAIALFTNAYIVSGSILGRNPPPPERSYLSGVTGTIKMIMLQFDLGDRQIKLIGIFAILFILYILVNSDARRELSKYVHSGLDLILLFIFSYTVLISLAMTKSQTVFEFRFMSPLVPFLFILCFLMIVLIWENIRFKGYSILSLCVLTLFLVIIIFGNCYKTYMKSKAVFSEDVGHYRILNSPTYHWIKDNYGENVIITTNRPFHLSFFGGYSTIRLPHKRFEKNSLVPDNMESYLPNRMFKFGSHVLALFEAADEQYEGSYVAKLFNKREDDDNFVLLQKFPDGVVYNLKK
jgi:hypothetical protein